MYESRIRCSIHTTDRKKYHGENRSKEALRWDPKLSSWDLQSRCRWLGQNESTEFFFLPHLVMKAWVRFIARPTVGSWWWNKIMRFIYPMVRSWWWKIIRILIPMGLKGSNKNSYKQIKSKQQNSCQTTASWMTTCQNQDLNRHVSHQKNAPSSSLRHSSTPLLPYLKSIHRYPALDNRTAHHKKDHIFDATSYWLFPKTPVSAKRVAWEVWFGGMIRGYDSPYLLYCLHKSYILYQRALSYTKLATGVVFWRVRLGHGTAKRGLGMIRGMYRVWFGVWFGQETVSAKIKKNRALSNAKPKNAHLGY